MTRRLRDYQHAAVAAVEQAWADGHARTLVVLPTGCGKTDVIARVATNAAREGERVLILAHRGELLDQIGERCRMHAPAIAVGRVQASRDEYGFPITVASQQTLASARRQARMPRPTRVIVDEAHHAPSKTYRQVLQWAGCFADKAATPTMGVTATPIRGDGVGLGSVWPHLALKRDILWATSHGPSRLDPLVSAPIGDGPDEAEHGWLVRPYGRVVVAPHLDLAKARRNVAGDDWSDGDLGRMVVQDVDQIVAAWLEHARLADGSYRATAAFMPTVDAAQALAGAFGAAGIKAEVVVGSTRPAERREIYARLAEGTTQVLCGVMVTTEGWDCPEVSCILQGRPTALPGLYAQIVGRGLRHAPWAGKADCLVLDVVGAARSTSLQTLVDLAPEAVYTPTPCPACGGERGGIEDEAEAWKLCSCACARCGKYTARARRRFAPAECCECPPERERDPAAGKVDLRGQQTRYETVDLLIARSPYRWLTTRRKAIPFVIVEDRIAGVLPTKDGLYVPGHYPLTGPGTKGERLAEPCSLDEARTVVEKWIDHRARSYRREARRKRADRRASAALRMRAARLGVELPQDATTAQAHDAIDIALASSRLERGRA